MLALTSDFNGTSRNSSDIRKNLEKIAGAGFSHVHWSHEWNTAYQYSVYEMLQIREWCGEFGLAVKGIHACSGENNCDLKDYTSANDYNRLAGVELIKNRIDLAHCLNAGAIVLHLYLPQRHQFEKEKDRELFLRPVLKSFNELESYCKTRQIKICLENNFENSLEHSCYLYDTLFNKYDGDFLGFCFDTGHALMACGENCLEYARRYNSRLFMIHVHDNQGIYDEHLVPFAGKFYWDDFAPVLASSPYQFPVLIESAFREKGDESAWLKKAFETGSRFLAMVEKLRQ